MKKFDNILPGLLIFLALIVGIFSAYTSTQRTLTSLESTLLQSILFISGLAGSYIFGKRSSKDAAKEIIKPHARSAFRRLMSLFESLSRVASVIEISQSDEKDKDGKIALAKLEAIVVEQLATADDALEDWRDIVPDDVEELRKQLLKPRNMRLNDE